MSASSDAKGVLSEEALARFADVKRGRRRAWADAGHLRLAETRNGYGELDVLELIAFAGLVRSFEWDDAICAWRDIRPELRDRPLSERHVVLLDQRLSKAVLLEHEDEIGPLVLNGHSFRVLDLSEDLIAGRRAYRELAVAKRTAAESRKVRRVTRSASA